MDLIIIRIVFISVVAVASYHLKPFGLANFPAWISACAGIVIGLAVVWFEARLRVVSLKRLIGAVIGSILGILGAYLFSVVIKNSITHSETQRFLMLMVMLLMSYVGLIVGANKGDLLNLAALGGIFGAEKQGRKSFKILDTSVIIDGRIADIADTGFLDGVVVIPQFVLRELQLVADSADSLKRNRGRRGLDILQRVQKMVTVSVQIVEDDFPTVREVDLKLIELAKVYEGKIITNDFNLNKVAQLQGVEVLNINELANALKPIVLPGETMRVFSNTKIYEVQQQWPLRIAQSFRSAVPPQFPDSRVRLERCGCRISLIIRHGPLPGVQSRGLSHVPQPGWRRLRNAPAFSRRERHAGRN